MRISKSAVAIFVFCSLFALNSAGWAETSSQSPFGENSVKILQSNTENEISSQAIESVFPCEGNVNCSRCLNVRNGPWGEIINGYIPGTRVKVVAREGDWYRIKYGSGYAFVHVSLVDIPGTPAYDGHKPSPFAKSVVAKITSDKTTTEKAKQVTSGGINGPQIPDCLLEGLAAAKKTQWFTTKDKCLQFAGTIAAKAGANVSSANSIYPHNAYKADKSLRGSRINALDDAALSGKLKPGMLIHVKAAYDKDPAYNPETNAHHWFVYMGLKNDIPMFADCLRDGRLQTIDEINSNMSAGRILLPQYKPYGNIRRVSAIYDPFADQR